MVTPIITLTTDWGSSDYFGGMLKGRLYSRIEGVRVVDICHDINRYDLMETSYIVRNACLGFPPGTIHLIDVLSEPPFVVVHYKEQYYICSDNGVPYSVFGDKYSEAVRLNIDRSDERFYTFSAFTIFCQVACELVRGTPLAEIGTPVDQLVKGSSIGHHQEDDGSLTVYVIYIDSYGNANLSIRYEEFEAIRRGRPFVLRVRDLTVNRMSHSYEDYELTDKNARGLMLTVSVTGDLQLALPHKSVENLVGITPLSMVRIQFQD